MLIKKALTAVFVIGIASFISLFCVWLVARQIILNKAEVKANNILEQVQYDTVNEEQGIVRVAQYIFSSFETKEPWRVPVLRIRPYVTNERLPEFIRLPHGVIETLIEQGYCDNAARMLSFILRYKGINSVQWDMVTATRGHSALLVYLTSGDKSIFVDPFYGFVTKDKSGSLVNPQQAQLLIQQGADINSVFYSLGNGSDIDFYEQFAETYMAPLGDDLLITASVPSPDENKALFLGTLDGRELDVMNSASRYGMTPYWQYVGHKYNRNWVRVLQTDVPVRIEMTLLEAVTEGVITSDPRPSIDGRKLIWNIDTGEQIVFKDGLAKISLKRMNSYIGVDQIAIYRR